MNVVDGLHRIRERLVANNALDDTLDAVDDFIERARRAPEAQAPSLTRLVGLLMRSPASNNNTGIYDDLTRLEAELAEATARLQAEREAVESRPMPKPTKFYKELKKKQREEKK